LPHLFGFFGLDYFIFLTTPTLIASFIMKSSTAAALSSFVVLSFAIIFYNRSMKISSYVCAVHVRADLLYSEIYVPSIHLYIVSCVVG
jgi:hypothetical protein